jgi:undecaprenyl-diphosphatase
VVLATWQAIVLGVVEGITEYLPVSSTGHLIITASLLGLDRPATKDALDAYLVVIQGGAILAVVALYWPRIVQMARGCAGRDPAGARLARNVFLAFLPAALFAPLVSRAIKQALFSDVPVLAALAVGGVWMLWIARRPRPGRIRLTAMPARSALGVGLFQLLALWPGTSRSMVTIGGGMLLGLDAATAAEFSFLVGLPTLGAACLHDLAGDLHAVLAGRPSLFAELGVAPTAVGIAVATMSAALAVRWLVAFLNRRGLEPFGWYRIGLAAALFASLWLGWVELGGPS